MTILNELDAQTLANYHIRSAERSRARRAEAENIKKDWVDKADGKHKPVERDAERLEAGQKRAREKLDAKFDDSKEGKAAKDDVIGKAAGQASHGYDGNPSYTSDISFRRGLNGLRRERGRGSDDEVTNLWFNKSNADAGANKANALKDRVSSLSRTANDKSNYNHEDDKKALDREVKNQARDKSFFRGTRSAGRALTDTASKIKNAAKRGVKSVSSGLSSLKKRVFGEEYYEDLDYRYTVIPLLDSLLEGNSTDIEYAFNEAVAHRIENAILTARLRIAEELDEARGLIDMGAGYGRRPDSPEERSEVAKALRTARKYNRDTRDFHKAHPNDDKKAQADKMKELNQHAKGSHSGTIKRTMDTGMQYRSGVQMPKVDNPNSQNISARAAVHSDKYPTHLKLPSPIRANQGKASWKKQPEMPE